ncbi:hypothetical protein Tco_1523628 [Tanacetum coccineum]
MLKNKTLSVRLDIGFQMKLRVVEALVIERTNTASTEEASKMDILDNTAQNPKLLEKFAKSVKPSGTINTKSKLIKSFDEEMVSVSSHLLFEFILVGFQVWKDDRSQYGDFSGGCAELQSGFCWHSELGGNACFSFTLGLPPIANSLASTGFEGASLSGGIKIGASAIFEKSCYESSVKIRHAKKTSDHFHSSRVEGVSDYVNLASVTSIPDLEILCPRTMPSFTMKWLFSQFRTKLVSSHRFNILSKWDRHVEKESPKTEKSSINTSIVFSIMSWKIAIIHRWNVPGALHSPKGMRR